MRALWPALLLYALLPLTAAQTPAPNATAVATAACADWNSIVMAEFETIIVATGDLTTSQRDDLQAFESHNAIQLKWAEQRTDTARITELKTGACGQFAARVTTKLAAKSAGRRAATARSMSALLSLLAMTHLSACY